MVPWYRNHIGEMIVQEGNTYLSQGAFKVLDGDVLEITELPLFKWTRDYKTFLEGMA